MSSSLGITLGLEFNHINALSFRKVLRILYIYIQSIYAEYNYHITRTRCDYCQNESSQVEPSSQVGGVVQGSCIHPQGHEASGKGAAMSVDEAFESLRAL